MHDQPPTHDPGSAPPPIAHTDIPYATSALTPQDESYLRVISVLHYVAAGILALFGCLPIVHVIVGFLFLSGNFPPVAGPAPAPNVVMPPAWFGYFFIIGGMVAIGLMWSSAVLLFLAGKYLSQRRRHTFILVVAAISCIYFPIGTALGIFTIVMINKPGVRETFTPAVNR